MMDAQSINWSTDMAFTINTRDNDRVFAEDFGEDAVWLSLATRSGSMFTVMTKEQAKELIDALQQVIA
jgi:hypothetical protein